MNEKLYKANIGLVDENKVLKDDKKILERRIEKAVEYINYNQFNGNNKIICINGNDLLEILKGE